MATKTFGATRSSIEQDLQRARINAGGAVINSALKFARLAVKNRAQYEAVENATGVPWFWIAATHARESSMNFKGVLHNGELIVGTGRRTRLVPAGRGPFATWSQAAIDGLTTSPHDMSGISDWSPARMCFEFEKWNGFGYRNKGLPSPYVWSGTNVYHAGKYVADGKFDRNAVDTQPGTWAILLELAGLLPEIAPRLQQRSRPIAPAAPRAPIEEARPSPKAQDDDGEDEEAPEAEAEVEADPVAITDQETVLKVQQRLRELKYGFGGDADGNAGELMKDALLAFRRVNGLPVANADGSPRAVIDQQLLTLIMSADAKPRQLSEERKNAQAPELAPKHEQVNQPWWQQLYAWVLGLPAGAVVLFKQWFPDADGDGVPDVLKSLTKIPVEVWAGGVLAVVVLIVISASKAKRAAVKARQEGRLF